MEDRIHNLERAVTILAEILAAEVSGDVASVDGKASYLVDLVLQGNSCGSCRRHAFGNCSGVDIGICWRWEG